MIAHAKVIEDGSHKATARHCTLSCKRRLEGHIRILETIEDYQPPPVPAVQEPFQGSCVVVNLWFLSSEDL